MSKLEAISLLMNSQYYKQGVSDVLNKIRTEIEQLSTTKCTETCSIDMRAEDLKEIVLKIIDKYKAESEE